MKIISLFISIFFINSCKYNIDTSKIRTSNPDKYCNILDTLVVPSNNEFIDNYSIEDLCKLEKFRKADVEVNYNVGDNNLTYYNFSLLNSSFKIVKDSCAISNKYITSFYKNNTALQKHIVYVKDSINYGFDNLTVDYINSSFFINNKMILIKNIQERNVGKATNWFYYQLLDLDSDEMYEFYFYNSR